MSGAPVVTVLVPTRALRERAASLREAVDSILAQGEGLARPVVVLNGNMRAPEVERALRVDARVDVIDLPDGGIPAALRAGRALVRTPYFTALDDDDLLADGALAHRLAVFAAHPDADVVVTNGFRRNGTGDALHIAPDAEVNADPLRAMLRRNWLLPGSWLCRTDRVGPELFAAMPRHLECTWLGVRFATEYRMRWSPAPTVIYRTDSPLAESRTWEFMAGQVDALRGILALELPPDVRRALERRVAAACHRAANRALAAGEWRAALGWHLRTLRERGGWRYLPLMRHIARRSLGGAAR